MIDQFGSDEAGKKPGNTPGIEPETETDTFDHADLSDQAEDPAGSQVEDLQDVPW